MNFKLKVFSNSWHAVVLYLLASFLLATPSSAQESPQKLHHHVPSVVSNHEAAFLGALPSRQRMQLSMILPLRNQAALAQLLIELYDPSSPYYRHFLTVEQFTDQFGPTAQDYESVIQWANNNGLTVINQSKNRLTLDVSGTAGQVNAALNVTMNNYRDLNGKRTFYSIDREPTLNLSVPVAHIEGLDNFSIPQPMVKRKKNPSPIADVTGSGPGGYYLGSDMRAAYYGGTLLTGAGQCVGLFEFGGYNLSDVNLTFNNAGQTYSVPINNVSVDGESPGLAPGYDDEEQVLDIVQAIGMAPGLSQVRVYVGGDSNAEDIFSSMATDTNSCKQLSVSWGWSNPDPTSYDGIFQEFAAQGQSLFVASGDDGAYDPSISSDFAPADDDYVTAVGGTHLTTNYGGGPWVAEGAWNNPPYGSGGGISQDDIPIPSWQQGVGGGSSTLRNLPDVAMEADLDNYYCHLGTCQGGAGGTSFAAPRWAAFIALVNQQATEAGTVPHGGIGFLNPSIYSIGQGASYSLDFHDITTGNNDSDNQPIWYNALPGYDLVTGWGSPNGQNLINALAGALTPGFWISSAPPVLSLNQGTSGTATISVTDADGFASNVSLSISGFPAGSALPAGVTASFNPTSTPGTSELLLTADSSAAVGTATLTVTGTSGTQTASTEFFLTINSPQAPPPPGELGSVNIGETGNPKALTLTFEAAGTLNNISVLTRGSPNLDFSNASGGTCKVGTAYAVNATCTVNVSFAPKYAGTRYGAVVLTAANGNQLAEVYLQGTGMGPQSTFNPGSETTIGSGFAAPQDVAIAGDGSIYVTDFGSAAVPGALYLEKFSNGSYTQSKLNCTFKSPLGVAVDGGGTVYVTDPGGPAVYKVTISSGSCTQTAISNFSTYDFYPQGIAVDGAGNLYVADSDTQALYIETLQPNGTYVQTSTWGGWSTPGGVAVDGQGNIYVADFGDPGVYIETPSGGGAYTTQTIIRLDGSAPSGIAVDGIGDIYVSETGNGLSEGGTIPPGIYKEVLSGGNYVGTPIGGGWIAPFGLAVDPLGNVLVADQQRGIYREDLADPPQLAFANTAAGTSSSDSPKSVTVSNLGTANLNFSALSYPVDFPEAGTNTSDCTPSTSLNSAQSCILSIEFLPSTSLGGNSSLPLNESVSVTTNTLNTAATQQAISVGGTEVLPGGSVNLIVSANPSTAGSSVTFTATVTGSAGGPVPTGTVTFYNGTTPLSGVISLSNAVATYSTASLALGTYAVSASYSGDGNYSGSNSNTISESILAAPGTAPIATTNLGNQNLGSTSGAIPLTFTFSQTETLGGIAVLTQGAANLDFANAGGGTCTTGNAYTVNSTCSVNVAFSPKFPGTRYGAVVLTDNNGNEIGTGYLEGTGVGAQTSFLPGVLTSVSTSLGYPEGVAVDGNANLYVADATNAAVYKETYANGTYTQSSVGNGFSEPYGVAVDSAGNIYVVDSGNHAVYKETLVNGSYTQTEIGYGFVAPMGVAVDGEGNVYVADFGNGGSSGVVYLETLSNGSYTQSTIAATFVSPQSVAVDGNGNVFVADPGNGNGAAAAVYELVLSNGSYNQISLGSGWITPTGVAVDGRGNLYVADDAYDTGAGFVNEETLQPDGSYAQTTILNSSSAPYPGGLATDGRGNLYLTENLQGGVYKEDLADPPSLSFAATPYGSTSSDSPKTVTVQNDGNVSLNFSAISYPTDFPEVPGIPTNCTSSTSLGSGATCSLSIDFTPASSTASNQSTQLSENVSITTNSLNASSNLQSLAVSGTEAAPIATVALTVPAEISTVGASVTFTATVTGESGFVAPTGSVTFYSSGTALGTTSLTNGTAAYSTNSLAVGNYTLTASYSGDQNYPSATSNAVNEQIFPASTFGTQTLGGSSSQLITITFASKTTLDSISVVTEGASNLDFTNAGGGTCTVGKGYSAGSKCTVNVSFKPLYTGSRYGAIVLGDNKGNLIQSVPMEGTGIGAQLSFLPGTEKTVYQNGGEAFVDENGSFYTDSENSTGVFSLTKWTPSGSSYTSTTIPTSSLNTGGVVAVDAAGSVYISNYYLGTKQFDCRILKETLVAGAYKETVVTSGQQCSNAWPIAVDASGNVYILDTFNYTILKETLSGGAYTQTTIPSGTLYDPGGIVVDGSGNLFVYDIQGGSYYEDPFVNRILKFTPSGGGYVESTIVSSSQVAYGLPVIDGNGDVFFSAAAAYTGIGQLDEAIPTGTGYTIISSGISTSGFSLLGFDGAQNLYLSTGTTITELDSSDPPSPIEFTPTNVGATSSDSPRTIPVENTGNAPLTLLPPSSGTNPSISINFSLDGTTTCPQANTSGSVGTLNIRSSCNYNIDFTPTTSGSINGSLVLTDNAVNGTTTIPLSGTGITGGSGDAVLVTLTMGPNGVPQVKIMPNATALDTTGYEKIWADTVHQTFMLGAVFLQENSQGQATCVLYDGLEAKVTAGPWPQFGTLKFDTESFYVPGCPMPFPFAVARYTWRPKQAVDQDPFVLQFSSQDGRYLNEYGVSAQLSQPLVQNGCLKGGVVNGVAAPIRHSVRTTLTLNNPPEGATSYNWTIDGGNGAIVFTNGQQTIETTTPSATVKYVNVNGGGYKANLSVKIAEANNPGELDYGPLSYISCAAILAGSVPKPPNGGTVIDLYFKPQDGLTLAQAEKVCGYFNFDWQQTITSMPLPSGVYAANDPQHLHELHAPQAFNDPPLVGYPPDPNSDNIVNAVRIPVYWNLYQSGYPWGVDYYETDNSLEFYDSPANNCLPGGSGANCGGQTSPVGSHYGFTTHLVGIQGSLQNPYVCDTGIGFSWTDNYNYTNGGINVTQSIYPASPGGTGGVEVTAYNDSPPSSSVPMLLSGAQISVTVSALTTSSAVVTITNISDAAVDGPFQIVFDSLTSGVTLANSSGSFGGWSYISAPGVESLAPGQSSSVAIQFTNPQNQTVTFVPIVYSGEMD